MAPPTIAPPIRPAATPAATPRWACAGVALSEPAIDATARRAARVFFILGLSWRWRAMAPGLGELSTLIGKLAAPTKKRQNGQPPVNSRGPRRLKKRSFSGR